MNWYDVLPMLTTEDVAAAGGCDSGVKDWIAECCPGKFCLPVDVALKLDKGANRKLILSTANLDGYGDGDGDGYGDGGN